MHGQTTGMQGAQEISSESHSKSCCRSRIPARQVVALGNLQSISFGDSKRTCLETILRIRQLSMCELLGAMPGAEEMLKACLLLFTPDLGAVPRVFQMQAVSPCPPRPSLSTR